MIDNKTRGWKNDLKDSVKDFIEIVYPEINSWLGEGEIIPVEAVTKAITNEHVSNMAEKLDIFSGIDYWFLFSKGCIRGLSSRVQWVYDDWSTFTVRRGRISGARTEYAKLLYAIENDYLYPYWTIQSYITIEKPARLLNAAICSTKDLILYIKSGEDGIDHWTNVVRKRGISYFYVVPWIYLSKNHEVKIYDEINMRKWQRGKSRSGS